jgi:hypothetical protein
VDMRATATHMLAGTAVVVPVLAVEIADATGGPDDVTSWVSGLAGNGLAHIADAADPPSRPDGWRVLVLFPGLDRLRIIVRSPDASAFFAGSCAVTDGWDELVALNRGCILLVGNLEISNIPRVELTPERVTRAVNTAAGSGDVVGGLIPVIWADRMNEDEQVLFAGSVNLGDSSVGDLFKRSPSHNATQATATVDEALRAVKTEAQGMSQEKVRERLVAKLLESGKMLPSRVVDFYANDIALGGSAPGRARRWSRRRMDRATAGWSALRSVEAMVRGRPVSHWHSTGIHEITASLRKPRQEVILDHGADRWLAIGEEDVFDVWLCTARANEPLIVFRGDERVGVLGATADAVYRPIVAESGHEEVVVVVPAVRSRAADSGWRLRICQPSSGVEGILERLAR